MAFQHGGFSLKDHLLNNRKVSPEDAKEFCTAIYHRLLSVNPRIPVIAYKDMPLNPAQMG